MKHNFQIYLGIIAVLASNILHSVLANPVYNLGPATHPNPTYVTHLDLVAAPPPAPAPQPNPIIFESFADATTGSNWHWETEISNVGDAFQDSVLTFYLPGGGTMTGLLSLEANESFYIDIIIGETPEVAFWTWFGLNEGLPDIQLSMDTAVSEIVGNDPGHDPGPLNPGEFIFFNMGGNFDNIVFGKGVSPYGDGSFGVVTRVSEPYSLMLFIVGLLGIIVVRHNFQILPT